MRRPPQAPRKSTTSISTTLAKRRFADSPRLWHSEAQSFCLSRSLSHLSLVVLICPIHSGHSVDAVSVVVQAPWRGWRAEDESAHEAFAAREETCALRPPRICSEASICCAFDSMLRTFAQSAPVFLSRTRSACSPKRHVVSRARSPWSTTCIPSHVPSLSAEAACVGCCCGLVFRRGFRVDAGGRGRCWTCVSPVSCSALLAIVCLIHWMTG